MFGFDSGLAVHSSQAGHFLVSFAVTFCFVLFQHRPRSHFLGPVTIAPGPLRTFLDVFVLPLLFCAHSTKVLFFWQCSPLQILSTIDCQSRARNTVNS
jgi:hypothetical protein